MSTVTVDCPACGRADALSFYSGVENGAPHGAGYWPMPVQDFDQECECELTDEQYQQAERAAGDKAGQEDAAYTEWLASETQAEFDARTAPLHEPRPEPTEDQRAATDALFRRFDD